MADSTVAAIIQDAIIPILMSKKYHYPRIGKGVSKKKEKMLSNSKLQLFLKGVNLQNPNFKKSIYFGVFLPYFVKKCISKRRCTPIKLFFKVQY